MKGVTFIKRGVPISTTYMLAVVEVCPPCYPMAQDFESIHASPVHLGYLRNTDMPKPIVHIASLLPYQHPSHHQHSSSYLVSE